MAHSMPWTSIPFPSANGSDRIRRSPFIKNSGTSFYGTQAKIFWIAAQHPAAMTALLMGLIDA